jgi:hypothetical protein
MAKVQIPQNQISFKYTSGGEYTIKSTNAVYQGHYYELNSKFYAGKEFKENAPELIKITPETTNSLLSRIGTALYGAISKVNINSSSPTSFIYTPSNEKQENQTIRYFTKKVNVTPYLIKEVNKETFEQFSSDPLYQTISIAFTASPGYAYGVPEEIDEAEKQMPGIKAFILG